MRDALIELDRHRGGLVGQLTAGLRAAVRAGRLAPNTRLPSSRALAADLAVSRGVVVEAYEQLIAEGFLVARHGSGTQVSPAALGGTAAATVRAPTAVQEPTGAATAAPQVRYNLRPGTPDLSLFPRTMWLSALRHVLATVPNTALGYGEPAGVPELRTELAAYLGRVRGTDAGPERVLVAGGVAQGLALVTRVLARAGHRRLAVEDPSALGGRDLLTHSGLELVGVPVDSAGVQVEALARTGARAILLTPAHQFPTGVVLSPGRRAALVDWARDAGAFIIEDDYDAEFRYDREPVGCLQGLAAESVVHLGSVSKSLAPGLRLGWMVLPEALVGPVRDAKQHTDYCSPVLEQYALAFLLSSGRYDRHLRAVRRRYRARRDALLGALARHLPEARAHGVAAGLHMYVELPDGCDEAAAVRTAQDRGVLVAPVTEMRLRSPAHGSATTGWPLPRPAVVLGYAGLSETRLAEAAQALAEAVRLAAARR